MFKSRRGITGLELLLGMTVTLGIGMQEAEGIITVEANGFRAALAGAEGGVSLAVDGAATRLRIDGLEDASIIEYQEGPDIFLALDRDGGTLRRLPWANLPWDQDGVVCGGLDNHEDLPEAFWSLPEVDDTVLVSVIGEGAGDGLAGFDLDIRGHGNGSLAAGGTVSYGQCWAFSGLGSADARVTRATFAVRNGDSLAGNRAAATMVVAISHDR